jgi:transcriptional regulator with XRE-family HTH domain
VPEQAPQPTETVEVKRRRLRFALRDARKESGLTQHSVAQKLSWSPSKIVRIEQGTVPVAPTDVRAMLSLYGVTDQDRVEALANLAIEARVMKGFKEYADVYSPSALELFGSEAAAVSIYKHEPTVIPGLLQTPDYARQLLLSLGNSEDTAVRKLAARSERQAVLERAERPELNFVIGEAAVSRPVGSDEIMREQLAELRRRASETDINLYILPFAAGAHRGLGASFTILQFANPDDPDVLYLENAERTTVSRDHPEELERYLELFVHLKELSERFGDFDSMIDKIAEARFNQPSR